MGIWDENLNDNNKWFVQSHKVGSQEDFDKYPVDYRNAVLDLYNNGNEYDAKVPVQEIWNDGFMNPDLYNSIRRKGLHNRAYSSYTPDEWKAIFDDYNQGYTAFKTKNPYVPYSQRADYGFPIGTYEEAAPAPKPQQTPVQNAPVQNVDKAAAFTQAASKSATVTPTNPEVAEFAQAKANYQAQKVQQAKPIKKPDNSMYEFVQDRNGNIVPGANVGQTKPTETKNSETVAQAQPHTQEVIFQPQYRPPYMWEGEKYDGDFYNQNPTRQVSTNEQNEKPATEQPQKRNNIFARKQNVNGKTMKKEQPASIPVQKNFRSGGVIYENNPQDTGYNQPITSMEELARAMGYTSPKEEEKMRKASVANQRIMAVADALRQIGNIYNTVHYAPSQQFNSPVEMERQRYQQAKALRDRANQTYISYQQAKAAQDAKQRQWEAQFKYNMAKDARDYTLKKNESDARANLNEAKIQRYNTLMELDQARREGVISDNEWRKRRAELYPQLTQSQIARNNRTGTGKSGGGGGTKGDNLAGRVVEESRTYTPDGKTSTITRKWSNTNTGAGGSKTTQKKSTGVNWGGGSTQGQKSEKKKTGVNWK